jgi:DHA1 family bicyclomycin/chloramphenicol resistance-like MFS transporter
LQTSSAVAGLTLSFFMIGFALGQLGAGPVSDRIGRRPVLLAGLCYYTTASIACTLAPSGTVLLISRLVQGVGAGAGSVLSFAMVQDLFEGDAARAKRSYVTVVFGAVPMLAPALGAALSGFGGWRAVHGVLAIAGGILSVTTWLGVGESRHADLELSRPVSAKVPRLRDDPQFVSLTLTNALSYGGIFTYIAGSPVVIIVQMRLSPAILAAVFACTAAALTTGAWTSGRLSRRGFGAATLLGPSLGVAAVAALALAIAGVAGIMSGAILLPPLLLVLFTRGIIAPNLQHMAIERQQEQAGAASAAVGVSQLLSGALGSALAAALLPNLGLSAVAIPMALFAASAMVVWRLIKWN